MLKKSTQNDVLLDSNLFCASLHLSVCLNGWDQTHGLYKLPSVSSDRDGYLDLDLVYYIRG